MTQRTPIFRDEAVEHWAKGATARGAVLRVESGRTRLAYWVVLALLVAGGAVIATVHTDEAVSGPAVIDPVHRTFTALLPIAVLSDLEHGHIGATSLTGVGAHRAVAVVTGATPADAATARAAGLPAPSRAGVLVSGTLRPSELGIPSAPSGRVATRARLVLRSDSVLGMFVHGLRAMLAKGASQ